jgi:hypothetical protein
MTVSGRVVDEGNKPIPGASIRFQFRPSTQIVGPSATSGQDGRFQIDGIPADGGSLIVSLRANSVTRRVVPSEKEEIFVLASPKVKKVCITVTDAESGQPVPAFNVVLTGLMRGTHSATAGRHEFPLNMPPSRPGFPALEIQIEAEGYILSDLRKVLPTDRPEIELKYQLRRGAPIIGVARQPNGEPAANADVVLRNPSQRIDIGDGQLAANRGFPVVHTGADGHFTFAPREGPFVVVAAHPSGFAVIRQEARVVQQHAPIEFTLRAWGRVEGVFKIGSRMGSNQKISLFVSGLSDLPKLQVIWRQSTTTDDEGRFVFERVLPSLVAIQRTVPITPNRGLLAEDIPAFDVKPKETIRLVIGGVGRPVIGRLEVPAEIKAKWDRVAPSGRITFEVHPPKPYDQLTDEEQDRWSVEWKKTYRSYGCVVEPNGSFRVEDVPAGTYQLKISVDEDYEEDRFHGSRNLGGITQTITVPEIPGASARTDEPLDLGSLPFEFDRGVKVGELAPDIQATTLDSKKPLKLSDYRGKVVLIVFWNSSTALNRPEAVGLKAVHSAFGNDARFVVLGLNFDTQGDEAKSRVAQYGWSWIQAKPGFPDGWNLRQKYGAYDLPSIWLIGRDGKVIARDLKAAAIKVTVDQTLRNK